MRAFNASINSGIDRIYSAAGEPATHIDRDGTTTPCTILVERNLTQYGETGQISAATVVVGVRRSELPTVPRRGDKFTLSTGASWTVDKLQTSDALEHKVFAA